MCKEFLPIFEELGEKYKDSKDIIIAQIDTTANELQHTKITSVPTLKYYKRGNETGVVFKGKLTLEGLVNFLESGGVQEEVAVPFAKINSAEDSIDEEVEDEEEEEEEQVLSREEL